jgi:hypothetical protein
MDSSEVGYFLLLVVGLPVLFILLTGPGLWSDKWGWRTLDALQRWWERRSDRKSAR